MRRELRFTKKLEPAKAELIKKGGRVVQEFTESAFVAEVPDGVALRKSTKTAPARMSRQTRLAVEAWKRNEAALKTGTRSRQTEGLAWDAPGYEPPYQKGILLNAVNDSPFSLASLNLSTAPPPTSSYLIGSVAVGIVMVSGTAAALRISEDEKVKIVQEVQTGLGWLASAEPRANVSFVHDIRPVTVDVPSGPVPGVSDQFEARERRWRDAALGNMGYTAGEGGYRAYVEDLRKGKVTDWAYVAFFTKYEVQRFAYAAHEKVVLNYENNSWDINDVHRVFAHETCHIFGAADEYGACSCDETFGHLQEPNGNCVGCFPPGQQQECLMATNSLAMCEASRKQIGWDESLFPG